MSFQSVVFGAELVVDLSAVSDAAQYDELDKRRTLQWIEKLVRHRNVELQVVLPDLHGLEV